MRARQRAFVLLGAAIAVAACGAPSGGTAPGGSPPIPPGDDAGAVDLVDGASDGAHACLAPTWVGAYGSGALAESTAVAGVAGDASGNVIVAGTFTDAIDFGGGALHSQSASDTYVAKLDSAGRVAWSERFGVHGGMQPLGVAANPKGDRVAVTGTFNGTATFGTITLTSADENVFLVMLDGSGAVVWARSFGGTGSDHGLGLAFAPDGSLVASGSFSASIDLGNGAVTTGAGAGAAYLAKLDADGVGVWSHAFDNVVIASNAVAVDGAGNVLVTGFAGAAVDLGGGVRANGGDKDALVAKFDPSGKHVYSATFGGPGDQYGYGAAARPDGSLVFTGGFDGAIDFGLGVIAVSLTGPDSFVAEVDPAGKVAWGVRGTKFAFGVSAAIEADGRVLVLADRQSTKGTTARSGSVLRLLAADGSSATEPFALAGELDSAAERAIVLPSGDAMIAGTFSGDIAICGVIALSANIQEVKSFLVDVPAR